MIYELVIACYFVGAQPPAFSVSGCEMPKWADLTFDDPQMCQSAARALTNPPLQVSCAPKAATVSSTPR